MRCARSLPRARAPNVRSEAELKEGDRNHCNTVIALVAWGMREEEYARVVLRESGHECPPLGWYTPFMTACRRSKRRGWRRKGGKRHAGKETPNHAIHTSRPVEDAGHHGPPTDFWFIEEEEGGETHGLTGPFVYVGLEIQLW